MVTSPELARSCSVSMQRLRCIGVRESVAVKEGRCMVVRRDDEPALSARTSHDVNLRSTTSYATSSGYTLIEIVVVFAIMGGLLLLIGRASGSFQFWRDEAFLRTLRERLEFLHYRAVSDQLSYQMEISLRTQSYRIGVLRDDQTVNTNVQLNANQSIGELSLELADFLNPATGSGATMIPPPSFPSLYEWVSLGGGSRFNAVRTRTEQITASTKESVYLVFHPEGFSEFAVIHLTLASGGPMTIVVNPFTGLTQSYRGHKDFRWTYGNR